MTKRTIVGFCASSTRPSRTADLVEVVTRTAGTALSASVELFDLFDIDESLRAAPFRTALDGPARDALTSVEEADALIVGAPTTAVGSIPGLLIHFFDLADPALLRGKPVLLVATGTLGVKPQLVALQLRLLFKVIHARPVPTVVYADKCNLRRPGLDRPLNDQIALATGELARMQIVEPRRAGVIASESSDRDEPATMWGAPATAETPRESDYQPLPSSGARQPRLSIVR